MADVQIDGNGAVISNFQIDITQNGTVTLATAGKYCPANVDVVVAVPVGEVEQLAAQQAIEDSLVTNTVKHYSNDRVTEVGSCAFHAHGVLSVSFPKVTKVNASAFGLCPSLTQVDFPLLEYLGDSAFQYCLVLTHLDLPKLNYIEMMGFYYSSLTTLILRNPQVCTLCDNMSFDGTPIKSKKGYIYVPDELVEQYKVATNWAALASQIRPISELEG